ncbi:hypothetical protein AGIG_G6292 [Arapaima gigas]
MPPGSQGTARKSQHSSSDLLVSHEQSIRPGTGEIKRGKERPGVLHTSTPQSCVKHTSSTRGQKGPLKDRGAA